MLLALLMLAAPTRRSEACTCLPGPGIEHLYASAEHVVRVNVRREVRRIHRRRGVATSGGTTRTYRAKVKESLKGCLPRGRILKIVTAIDSGLCGAVLHPRKEYVVALRAGDRNVFEVNACDFLREASTLTPHELEFLETRSECCGDDCRCTSNDEVSCVVDPCQLESCGDATCIANYCGGCTAEFFDSSGTPTCTACETDFDCGVGQGCTGGLCVAEAACGDDTDCPAQSWCRPTAAGGSACVPFAAEGRSCGGFTPPWAFRRCQPGSECRRAQPVPGTPVTPDSPGICSDESSSNDH